MQHIKGETDSSKSGLLGPAKLITVLSKEAEKCK